MRGDVYVDIGVVEPASGAPITFAAYFRAPGSFAGINPAAEAVLAQVGRVLAEFARVRPS